MPKQVATKGRREIGKITFIKTFINVAGAAFIFCVPYSNQKYTVNIFQRQSVCIYLLFRLSNMDFEERNFEE